MHVNESDLQGSIREHLPIIEVAGYPVRCIASNIRAKDNINWKSLYPVNGVGFEGNLLLGQIESVGARREMEETFLSSAPIILSLGTAAEIGKTTTAVKLIEGFKSMGIEKVAASKLAGTGRKRDIKALEKAGANPAYDFPDVGLATTYTSVERYLPATYTLLNKINMKGNPDIIIAECGGDIIEGNIPVLLQDPNIMGKVAAIIHGSTDVLSIMGSLVLYEKWGILGKVPIYLTYPIRRNYFAIHERLREQGIAFPIFDPIDKEEMDQVIRDIMRLL